MVMQGREAWFSLCLENGRTSYKGGQENSGEGRAKETGGALCGEGTGKVVGMKPG